MGNFQPQSYQGLSLNYVTNQTQRLSYGYSLLLRQYSLDEAAFRYWDELKKNTQENSGLYDRQPSFTPGNICNLSDPEEHILGFFSVGGVTDRRIFVREVPGLEKYDDLFCLPAAEPPRLRYYMNSDLPLYMSRATIPELGVTRYGETTLECLDCRLKKGSQGDPPSFWPETWIN
ncbi:MAG: DUF4249 family protein [Bacteroidales bacterium]